MVKIAAVSDTHTLHQKIDIPQCDILIHCGDFSGRGTEQEFEDFIGWFANLEQARWKIFIAGNHDFSLQRNPEIVRRKELRPGRHFNTIYLQDDYVIVEGLKIYGTPWTRFFFDWAFNALDFPPGKDNAYYGGPGESASPDRDHPLLEDVYSKIPLDTDILVCHNPMHGFLDRNREGILCGSHALLKHVSRVQPRILLGGHIHEAKGHTKFANTDVYNVSSVLRDASRTGSYLQDNPVTIIEI